MSRTNHECTTTSPERHTHYSRNRYHKNSLHAFSIVGLPDKAVDEAKDRVSSALKIADTLHQNHKTKKLLYHLHQQT